MKSLKFLSLWIIPAMLLWWEVMQPRPEEAAALAPCPDQACIDTVNVRLADNCELSLQPSMVVAPELDSTCLADLKVEVFYQNQSLGTIIPAAYVGKVLSYKLTNTQSGKICWGHVRVEDKTPPSLACPDNTTWAVNTAYANMLSGVLENSDFDFSRRNFTCWLSAQTPEQGQYFYDTIEFKVAKDGIYTFVLLHDFVKSDLATGAIFQGSFVPELPCQNIVGFTESRDAITNGNVLGDWWNDLPFIQQRIPWLTRDLPPFIRMELELKQDQTYYLVTTSLKPEDTGNYAWLVFRDEITQQPNTEILKGKPVVELPWITNLVCDDFNKIKLPGNACYRTDRLGNIVSISNDLHNVLKIKGFPHKGNPWFTRGGAVSDNCGDVTICVGDEVQASYGTCDSTVIKRTFAAVDLTGNGTLCTQMITIKKPSIQAVVLPNYIDYIECDESFPIDSTGFPHPSVTGYPFVRTAFGLKDLKAPFCNLAATYQNTARVDICDNAYTFIREWTIYDWCNPGSTLIYKQLIKVGDFTPPEASCQWDEEGCPIVFSTGPFACTATITIPAPDSIRDNCSNWQIAVDVVVVHRTPLYTPEGDLEDYEIEEIVIASNKKPGDMVAGLPRGLHYFRYKITDDCQNTRLLDCEFEVQDLSEPITICNDSLHISLGSTTPIIKIFATDIDEGSFDNCSNIKLQIRRIVEEDCIVDYESYLEEYTDESDTTDTGSGNPIDEPPLPGEEDDDPPMPVEEDSIYYSDWADYIYLTCCDVGRGVRVEMRVWDDADGNGIPGEWEKVDYCGREIKDNYNICWLNVLVEDKTKPTCKPPLDLTIACTDSLIRYESTFTCADSTLLNQKFGEFIGADNCGAVMICENVLDERDNCGFGKITRIYYAEDASGNRSESCQQMITVTKAHNYEIKFPADLSGECKIVRDTLIETQNLACDLLAVSVKDEVFTVNDGGCYKIERTFQVINWCEYDGVSDAIVVSRDEDCDGKPGDEAVYVLRRPGAGNAKPAFIDRNNNELDRIPAEGNKTKNCDGKTNPPGYWRTSNATGFWQYTQILKVTDNTPPQIYLGAADVFCIQNNDCQAEITIPFTLDEDCSFENVKFEVVIDYYNDSIDQEVIQGPRIRGEYPKYRYVDSFPIGEHVIEIRVKDGCNNFNSVRTKIRLEDCKAPSPICINGLAAELMPVRPIRDVNGDSIPDAAANLIWASDFIASEVDDCTPPITYSISRLGEIPNRDQTSLLLTCEDAGKTLSVAIYAWDNANNPRSVQPDGTEGGPNYDYCITYVLVQDNLLNCENPDSNRIAISGKITTEYNVPVEGVKIAVQNGANQQTQSNEQGLYSASANIANGNHVINIMPDFDDHAIQNVSTFDIILITKHILGSQLLDSPYKIIAADANNSESVSLLDVIQLRKLILGIDTRFTKNKSWRFVEKAFQFPQLTQPWATPFPESMQMNAAELPAIRNADFIAIKIGDVNPAPANNIRNAPASPLKLMVADQWLEPHQTYKVRFAADTKGLDGYQFTLQFEPKALELLDVEYGIAKQEHFGWRYMEQGQITTSWNATEKTEATGEQTLFTLTFSSKVAGSLQDYLEVKNRPTLAEAYDNQGNIKNIQLSFSSSLNLQSPFALYQNRPNPFSEGTIIGFYMQEAATARLQVYSTEGRLIKNLVRNCNSGYQEIIISNSELLGAGVYYYTLEVNGWKETRKMLLH